MYLLNNLKFDINISHTIGDTQYPYGWFLDAANREAVGVIVVPDSVYPDPSLFTYVENPDGSLTTTPRSPEDVAAMAADKEASRIASLWQAAHDYEYAQISGSATALLVMGVMQALPKSLAIKAWIKSIWTEYYIRKAAGSTNFDFSSIGPIPHTVPEMMVELGE